MQVVQFQIARFVSVAHADKEERHAHLARVAGHARQILPFRRHAVGKHDDSRQRRATEIVEHLADGGAELARLARGPQAADRLARGFQLRDVACVGDTGGAAGTVINVDLHPSAAQQVLQPGQLVVAQQRLGELQPLGRR